MISGISGYGSGSYVYQANNVTSQEDNNIKNSAAVAANTSVKADDANVQPEVSAQSDKQSAKTGVAADSRSIMDSFRGGKELNIFGSTSRFNEIQDADKAVADKKKDDILDRYTYFVNPVSQGLGTDEDGTVRIKTAK